MNTQSLEFKTKVPNEEKGKREVRHWDAWGTSGDAVHCSIEANIISAYHDFHQRALQTYWVSGQFSHGIYDSNAIGGDECSDIIVYASNTLEYESPDLIAIASNYQVVYKSIVATTVGELEQTFSAYPTTEMATLEGLYDLRDRLEVMEFVASNLFLLPLLQQIPEQTKKYFGEPTHLSLEVVVDHEEKNDKELVAFICTSLSPDDAFVRLRSFDRDWWLARLADTRGKLSVHVELQ